MTGARSGSRTTRFRSDASFNSTRTDDYKPLRQTLGSEIVFYRSNFGGDRAYVASFWISSSCGNPRAAACPPEFPFQQFPVAGTTPEPPGPIKLPAQMDCDLRLAARACQMLSLCEPPYGWRGAVRVAHRLQTRTGDFVEQHWHLIALLAGELVRHQELEQAQIEAILMRAGLMPRRVPCVPEVRAASG